VKEARSKSKKESDKAAAAAAAQKLHVAFGSEWDVTSAEFARHLEGKTPHMTPKADYFLARALKEHSLWLQHGDGVDGVLVGGDAAASILQLYCPALGTHIAFRTTTRRAGAGDAEVVKFFICRGHGNTDPASEAVIDAVDPGKLHVVNNVRFMSRLANGAKHDYPDSVLASWASELLKMSCDAAQTALLQSAADELPRAGTAAAPQRPEVATAAEWARTKFIAPAVDTVLGDSPEREHQRRQDARLRRSLKVDAKASTGAGHSVRLDFKVPVVFDERAASYRCRLCHWIQDTFGEHRPELADHERMHAAQLLVYSDVKGFTKPLVLRGPFACRFKGCETVTTSASRMAAHERTHIGSD
jgi:hypothetical protein